MPKPKKTSPIVSAPWRLAMIETGQSEPAKALYKERKQTVEPALGLLKSIPGSTRFSVRGIEKVKSEGTLFTLADNVHSGIQS